MAHQLPGLAELSQVEVLTILMGHPVGGGPNPLSLTIHHCQIGAELGRARALRSNQQKGSGLRGLSSSGRYGRHVSAVREFPKFWDKYVE